MCNLLSLLQILRRAISDLLHNKLLDNSARESTTYTIQKILLAIQDTLVVEELGMTKSFFRSRNNSDLQNWIGSFQKPSRNGSSSFVEGNYLPFFWR